MSETSISGAAGDGILATNTDASLFERNDAHANGDDGIDIDSVGPFTGPNTVTRNTANFNGDLGIEAVSGTIDGGGNKAKGNGNPEHCFRGHLQIACLDPCNRAVMAGSSPRSAHAGRHWRWIVMCPVTPP